MLDVAQDLLEIIKEGSRYKTKMKNTGISPNTKDHILEPARGGYRRIIRVGFSEKDVPFIEALDQYNPIMDATNKRDEKKDSWFDRTTSPFNFQVKKKYNNNKNKSIALFCIFFYRSPRTRE